MEVLMNDLNGTQKRAALPAHQGTDKWFAVGDTLAEQPAPSAPDTREVATITGRRARRAEQIGVAAGLLTLAVVLLVALLPHHRSAPSAVPVAAVAALPQTPPAPVAPAAKPVAAPAPAATAPAPAVAAPAPTVTVKTRSKHKKTAHSTAAPRHH
jgi:pyruvate dehydrogenase E2 component (dihydrolipoamide acetyltransferase)